MFVSILSVCEGIERILLEFTRMESVPVTRESVDDFECIALPADETHLVASAAGAAARKSSPITVGGDFDVISLPNARIGVQTVEVFGSREQQRQEINDFVTSIQQLLIKGREYPSTRGNILTVLKEVEAQFILSARSAHVSEIVTDCHAQILVWLETKLTGKSPTSLPSHSSHKKVMGRFTRRIFKKIPNADSFDSRMIKLRSALSGSAELTFAIALPKELVSMPTSSIPVASSFQPDNSIIAHCLQHRLVLIEGPHVDALLRPRVTPVTNYEYSQAVNKDIKQLGRAVKLNDYDISIIRNILTNYHDNPCLQAWQLIVAAMQKEYIYIYETQDASDKRPLFYINLVSPAKHSSETKLRLEYVIDVRGIFTLDAGIIENKAKGSLAKEGVLARCIISCCVHYKIRGVVTEQKCHIETESEWLRDKFKVVVRNLDDIAARKQNLRQQKPHKIDKQCSQAVINTLPLSLSVSLNLLDLYRDLKITSKMLREMAQKDKKWRAAAADQAAKDYRRHMLAVQGIPLDSSDVDAGTVKSTITKRLSAVSVVSTNPTSPVWSDEQHDTLELLLPQGFGNPGETAWILFSTILANDSGLILVASTGANGTEQRSNLQILPNGDVSLTAGYRVNEIKEMTGNMHSLPKNAWYLDFTMTVILPKESSAEFQYPEPAKIILYPGCEPFITPILKALVSLKGHTSTELQKLYQSELHRRFSLSDGAPKAVGTY